MSFSVKATHAYIKPQKEEPSTSYGSTDNNTEVSTNNMSNVHSGSSKGMAVRSTVTGQNDHF